MLNWSTEKGRASIRDGAVAGIATKQVSFEVYSLYSVILILILLIAARLSPFQVKMIAEAPSTPPTALLIKVDVMGSANRGIDFTSKCRGAYKTQSKRSSAERGRDERATSEIGGQGKPHEKSRFSNIGKQFRKQL